jgi:hypothetical protein
MKTSMILLTISPSSLALATLGGTTQNINDPIVKQMKENQQAWQIPAPQCVIADLEAS